MRNSTLTLHPIPVGAIGRRGVGYWGLIAFLASEAALFGYLIFSYTYIGVQLDPSLAEAARLSFTFAVPMTIVVIISSIVLWWGERAIQRNRTGHLAIALAIALVLSISFVVLEAFEWKSLPFTLTSSALSSAYFITTGMHLAHFIVGIVALLFFIPWVLLGYFDATRNTHVLVMIDYWHFVHAVWGVIFIALYCVPYLG